MNDLVIVLNQISNARCGHNTIKTESLETDSLPVQSIVMALQCFET